MLSAASALALTLAVVATTTQPPASPAAPQAADRPFTHLVTNLGHDLRALPSSDTAFVLALGGGGAILMHPTDDNLSGWVRERGPSGYTKFGDFAGNGWVQAGAAVATYAIGTASDRPKVAHIGSDLIRGQVLTGLITRGLKVGVDRTRPSGGRHSFPSGHSSAAFLTASVLGSHFGWKTGGPLYAAAGFIAWTRVRDNQHWLTDVIVGGTVGTIVGRTVTAGHRQRGWVVAPTASTSSVGVFVMKR